MPEHDVAIHWETAAEQWIAWTRAPGHDLFWSYRDGFRAFLPPPGEATLEVGCGEGRIARELTDLGHDVTAVDLSPTLLRAARDAGSARRHVRADAEALPFAEGAFDRVVAYNVLMDVADMPAAVGEIARVLRGDGLAMISIVHPFVDRARIVGTGTGATLVVDGTYFGTSHFTVTDERDGLAMSFAGWSRSLTDYVAALRDAGLVVVDLLEPRPDRAEGRPWDRFPLFCWLTVRRC